MSQIRFENVNYIYSGGTTFEKQALKEGMMTLKLSCAKHVLNGITSLSEMRKIVYEAGDEY